MFSRIFFRRLRINPKGILSFQSLFKKHATRIRPVSPPHRIGSPHTRFNPTHNLFASRPSTSVMPWCIAGMCLGLLTQQLVTNAEAETDESASLNQDRLSLQKTELVSQINNVNHQLAEIYQSLPIIASEQEIERAIDRMANEIRNQHSQTGQKIKLLCLLNGARNITFSITDRLGWENCEVIYTTPSSYKGGMHSGKLAWPDPPEPSKLQGIVTIIDDVWDTGKTLDRVNQYVEHYADLVNCAVLVNKVQKREYDFKATIIGIETDEKAFILGRGMDYKNEFREEPDIRQMDPKVLPKLDRLILQKKQLMRALKKVNEEIIARNKFFMMLQPFQCSINNENSGFNHPTP